MNLNLDIALCIGGPCPVKNRCARWVVYDSMARAEQRGDIEFTPSVVITTPPFNYNDEGHFYMPSQLQPSEP